MRIYYYDAFFIVKIRFLFGVNVCAFIPMMLFMVKNRDFLLVLMYVYIFL